MVGFKAKDGIHELVGPIVEAGVPLGVDPGDVARDRSGGVGTPAVAV